jgi:rare lipoprotein A
MGAPRTKNSRPHEPAAKARCDLAIAAAIASLLAACGSAPVHREPAHEGAAPARERSARISKAPASASRASSAPRTTRGGGYYLDDGPGDNPPADLDSIPEPVPQWEPLARGAMKPYVVMGQTFTPMTELQPYKARGIATWYGRRYHGKQTSSGEVYDMYAMTAAHPILPIPSYARVTNVANGKSVIVRINDRGPFIDNRLIDLSYTAAYRIGVLGGGSAVVQVESILPDASGPSNTMIASAPAARTRYAAARASASPQAATPQASTPAQTAATAAPPLDALSPTASELASRADPIVAIAAAAREPAPIARPLGDAPPEAAVAPVAPVAIAAARAGAPPAAAAATPAREIGGVYLQLGAFGSKENAEHYLARAKAQAEWAAQLMHLLPRDGMYRVQSGPYASPGEARLAAERMAAALGVRPMVVNR